jgi:L-lactate dehydrogenase complex protein LldG
MTTSRREILSRLQRGTPPFPGAEPPVAYLPMVQLPELEADALQDLFVFEAQKAACLVHQAASHEEAVDVVLRLIGEETLISCWEPEQIPLPGLEESLRGAGITCVGQDASVRLGVTGVDAALAATGSLVLRSGNGRYRAASLLPQVHVAVVDCRQILPDLEHWWARQREGGLDRVRRSSNIVVISGPSRTADIAMELVMGMHGPRELHIVLISER